MNVFFRKFINLNSPWGKGPKGGNENEPGDEIDKMLKQGGEKIRNLFEQQARKRMGGGSHETGFAKIALMILAVAFLIWLASGFYIVREGERAAVMRFGKFSRIAMPGPNYYLPTPFENIVKLKVDKIQKEEFGIKDQQTAEQLAQRFYKGLDMSDESKKKNIIKNHSILMLTGDENIVDISFSVQWKIVDIKKFVFNIEDPVDTLKNVSESAMREIIGETPVAEAHTEGKTIIQTRVRDVAQKILDQYSSGIEIVNLQLLKVDPPLEVIDAYLDVQTARADKERIINEAMSYRNDVIPKARGNASKIVQEAEGYKESLVAEAHGVAEQFNLVHAQYRNAPNVTRKRIYLETMEKVLGDMDKVIIDNKNGTGVLPYLPLEQFKNQNSEK